MCGHICDHSKSIWTQARSSGNAKGGNRYKRNEMKNPESNAIIYFMYLFSITKFLPLFVESG